MRSGQGFEKLKISGKHVIKRLLLIISEWIKALIITGCVTTQKTAE